MSGGIQVTSNPVLGELERTSRHPPIAAPRQMAIAPIHTTIAAGSLSGPSGPPKT